jgi:hypothetical protein
LVHPANPLDFKDAIMRSITFSFPVELEYDKKSVEYKVKCQVHPGVQGNLSGPPEKCYPSEGPEIESLEVWAKVKRPCKELGQELTPTSFSHKPSCPSCHGLTYFISEERRPELDELIDEETVIENLPEPDYDYDVSSDPDTWDER